MLELGVLPCLPVNEMASEGVFPGKV